jgi:transposase
MEAAALFRTGFGPAEVARQLGVSCTSACRWHATWLQEGAGGLRAAGRAGRLPQLDDRQWREVERALLKGPTAHGFGSELWTLERVATVIERVSGVRHHPAHVSRLLRERGWSRQKPARRAVERDEEAIERWVREEWPRIKRGPASEGPGSSSWTRAGSR